MAHGVLVRFFFLFKFPSVKTALLGAVRGQATGLLWLSLATLSLGDSGHTGDFSNPGFRMGIHPFSAHTLTPPTPPPTPAVTSWPPSAGITLCWRLSSLLCALCSAGPSPRGAFLALPCVAQPPLPPAGKCPMVLTSALALKASTPSRRWASIPSVLHQLTHYRGTSWAPKHTRIRIKKQQRCTEIPLPHLFEIPI